MISTDQLTLLLYFFNEYRTTEQAIKDTKLEPAAVMEGMSVLSSHTSPYLFFLKIVRRGYAFKLSTQGQIFACQQAHNGNGKDIHCINNGTLINNHQTCQGCQHNPTTDNKMLCKHPDTG